MSGRALKAVAAGGERRPAACAASQPDFRALRVQVAAFVDSIKLQNLLHTLDPSDENQRELVELTKEVTAWLDAHKLAPGPAGDILDKAVDEKENGRPLQDSAEDMHGRSPPKDLAAVRHILPSRSVGLALHVQAGSRKVQAAPRAPLLPFCIPP